MTTWYFIDDLQWLTVVTVCVTNALFPTMNEENIGEPILFILLIVVGREISTCFHWWLPDHMNETHEGDWVRKLSEAVKGTWFYFIYERQLCFGKSGWTTKKMSRQILQEHLGNGPVKQCLHTFKEYFEQYTYKLYIFINTLSIHRT